jgi:hypothetical protein
MRAANNSAPASHRFTTWLVGLMLLVPPGWAQAQTSLQARLAAIAGMSAEEMAGASLYRSFSTMVAARFAFETIENVAQDLGLEPGSREASKVAWFVLSRVGDFRIYDVYQKAGYSRQAAKEFVRSVIENPAPYEAANWIVG